MNRTLAFNTAGLAIAIAATVAVAWPRATMHRSALPPAPASAHGVRRTTLPDGAPAILDSTSSPVRLRHYQRVVSTNLVTDRLLVELCPRGRIAAISRAGAARPRDGFRYQGLATVDGFGPVEALLALHPDLILINSFGVPGYAQRLRDAGVEVFDLGELRGTRSFRSVALAVGELLELPQRAAELVLAFEARLRNVCAGLGSEPRKHSMFLSTLGPDLQGGTVGTSYYDILTAAGLIDVAADKHHDWPAYSAEQVLALAPEIIVTREGFSDNLCRFPGMNHVPPCQGKGRIVELPGELLDEPGLAMLDAAEMLFRLVYSK